jgi:hypothetical protein
MWLRLRQIALVASDLAAAVKDLRSVLGVEVCFNDPGVGRYGLENALMPIGNQFVEVVAPVEEDTAGGRYLERRGGDGGYMVITQCDEHAPRKRRVRELGIRTVTEADREEYRIMQLHPKDTGGSFFEIDEQLGERAHDVDGPWEPAGGGGWPRFRRTERVTGIVAAEIQCDDPAAVARRWSEIAEVPLAQAGAAIVLPLENASLRFVPCTDGRPEGLGGIDVTAADRDAILAAARERGAYRSDGEVHLVGMRVRLSER